MRCALATIVGVSLLGLVSSNIIPPELEASDSSSRSNKDTLIFSHVMTRHGESELPYSELSPLTKEGKRQLYSVGQFLRRQYGDLCGQYDTRKVYVFSTDTDRAIMSALATMAGLYPPKTEEEKWNDQIFWQPIPVHSLPDEYDTLLHGGKPCPKYDKLYKYYMERSPEAVEMMKKHGDLIKYWSKMSERNLKNIEDVTNLYKRLTNQKDRNETLPDWAEEAIKKDGPMEEIVRVTYKLRGTPELVRRRSGFLIKDILERSAQKINGTLDPDRVLWIYSGHSSTLATMLNGLQIFVLNIPPNGSTLHFELYKTPENKYYLQFVYRRFGVENPLPANIPNLGEKWTLDQFYSVLGEIIPGDFESECEL